MFSRLKIGKKVAVLRFDVMNNQDKLVVGKIVGIIKLGYGVKRVVVEYSDGRIGVHYESELLKKWDEGLEK